MMRRVLLGVGVVLSMGLGGCENTTEKPAELGKDYYPLKVGAERVYAVEDVVWLNNRATRRTSQLRERLTETYRDAAGELTYKLVRSVRNTAADAWQDDSVQAITVLDRSLLLTRSNVRTVELVFPVRAGAVWNLNAFNDRDTIIAENRRYEAVGEAYTAGTRSYEPTVTTLDEAQNNAIYLDIQRQVFAKGVGPVFRERRKLNYCQNPSGSCTIGSGYIETGTEHRETLVP